MDPLIGHYKVAWSLTVIAEFSHAQTIVHDQFAVNDLASIRGAGDMRIVAAGLGIPDAVAPTQALAPLCVLPAKLPVQAKAMQGMSMAKKEPGRSLEFIEKSYRNSFLLKC